MTGIELRSAEERTLLNAAFCAHVLWRAASGAHGRERRPLTFAEAFLVLPIVLTRSVRDVLPQQLRSSLPSWLSAYPEAAAGVVQRAPLLAPFTREALLFASRHRVLEIDRGDLIPFSKRDAAAVESAQSSTVKKILSRAEFVGRWFVRAGEPATVFTLIGVKP